MRPFWVLLSLTLVWLTTSCETSRDPRVIARNAKISQEPAGDYFMGRRYWVRGSRTWGWVRRPGEPWDKARLVITNEKYKRNPDRYPEFSNPSGLQNGFDHNVEYRLRGYFSGDEVYDPTTNMVLPEFVLQDYEVTDRSPGWLFKPTDNMGNTYLPRSYVMILAEKS